MYIPRCLMPSILAGSAAVCVFAAVLTARPVMNAAPAAPANVAVVDWLAVTDQLTEWKEVTANLTKKDTVFRDEANRRQAALNQMKEDLSVMPADSPAYEDAAYRYSVEMAQFNAWGQASQKDIEAVKLREQLRIYDKINKAIAAVAEREGYQIVVWNDSESKKIDLRNPQESAGQIATRHVLYVSPSAPDITKSVAEFMNQGSGG